MNATLAVFRLEIRERVRVFAVAAALALLPFLIAALPRVRGRWVEALGVSAFYAAIVYTAALAIAIGGSTIVTPLRARRLSFYFSRPVTAAALWFGKLTAALATCAASCAIIILPAALVLPSGTAPWSVAGDAFRIGFVLSIPAMIVITHAIASMVASRSIRLAVDFVLAIAAAAAVVYIARPLLVGGAMETVGWFAVGGLALLIVMLAIAPVWQLERGRADVRQSHAALSTFLWVSVAIILVASAAGVAWIVSAPLASLRVIGAFDQTANGRWAVIGGESTRAGYHAAFLVDSQSEEVKRLRNTVPWSEMTFSGDGRTLVRVTLAELIPSRGASEIILSPLETGGVSATIKTASWPHEYAVTADARRAAVVTSDRVELYDSVSGRMLAAARRPAGRVHTLFFVTPDVLRLIAWERSEQQNARNVYGIYELALADRKLERTGEFRSKNTAISVSQDGSRMLLVGDGALLEGRTGAVVADVGVTGGAILDDGRVAVAAADGDGAVLRVHNADGVLRSTIAFAEPNARVVAQVGASRVLVAARDRLMLVDIDQGRVVRQIENARVLPMYRDRRLLRLSEDAVVAGIDAQRRTSFWNLATGEKKPI